MSRTSKLSSIFVAIALLAAACGEGSGETVLASEINGGKPEVEINGGDSPTELVTEDLVAGTGEVAAAGDFLVMHYVGVLFDDGSQFDASWDRDQTFGFILGTGSVIQGWDDGIEGMATGGRRQLTIPAQFAYGDNSPTPAIPPASTLVFVVDLIAAVSPHDVDTTADADSELDVTVIAEGDGAEVGLRDVVEVVYSLGPANGPVTQSSWTDGRTLAFAVGDQAIPEGWNQALEGSRVGDELRVVLPPELGPNPQSNETVVSHITVVSLDPLDG